MAKHYRLELSARIIEIDGALKEHSIIADNQLLERHFLVTTHSSEKEAQAALLGQALGIAFADKPGAKPTKRAERSVLDT